MTRWIATVAAMVSVFAAGTAFGEDDAPPEYDVSRIRGAYLGEGKTVEMGRRTRGDDDTAGLGDGSDVRNLLKIGAGTIASPVVSTGSAVGKEAVQVVAGIVVDRATTAAFELARTRTLDLLGCSEDDTAACVATCGKVSLCKTCRLLASASIPQLASSNRTLLHAVVTDVRDHVNACSAGEADPTGKAVLDLVLDVLVPAVVEAVASGGREASEILARQLIGRGMEWCTAGLCGLADERSKALGLAAAAVAKCEEDVSKYDGLGSCPVPLIVDRIAGGCKGASPSAAALAHARTIGLYLAGALDQPGEDQDAVLRLRLRSSVEAAYAVAMLYLRLSADGSLLDPPHPSLSYLKPLRGMMLALIEKDTNSALSAGLDILELVSGAKDEGIMKRRRGFRLLAAIAQYGQTYVDASTGAASKGGTADAEAAHSRRVEIMESLTRELTVRAGRDEDQIWAVAGSLRVAGGARLDYEGGSWAQYGPVGLTLGISYKGERSSPLFFEAGILDLGQYVAVDEGKVGDFEWANVFSPTLSLGWWFGGADFPAFVALTAAYTPAFPFEDGTNRATVSAGVAVGLNVPLMDLN